MGMSTDAILFYGIALPEGDEASEVVERIFDTKFGSPSEDGIIVGQHCCSNEPMFYIAAAELICWRGHVQDASEFVARHNTAEMNEKIKDFCAREGIEHAEPRWNLVVYAEI
jgi:hypothetical protein